jgi:hypothetical protein
VITLNYSDIEKWLCVACGRMGDGEHLAGVYCRGCADSVGKVLSGKGPPRVIRQAWKDLEGDDNPSRPKAQVLRLVDVDKVVP